MVFLDPPSDSVQLLQQSLPESYISGVPSPAADASAAASGGAAVFGEDDEVLAFVASLAGVLTKSNDFSPDSWKDALGPYLATLPSLEGEAADTLVERFREAAEKAVTGEDDETDDEEDESAGEMLTNIRFSLAYGGKILLHQTKLRLRRGHKYVLLGQNGVGKTTLMTAIDNGKLDGWPNHLKSHYVDSGSNVDPVYEAKHVFPHLIATTQKPDADCRAMLQTLKFTDTMIEGTIGELSGGWQMKLRLAEAVLVAADILLLDEPTNHLDSGTVTWLTDYLSNLTDTTVLVVSHDIPFIENVCTDVIHYEKRAEQWGPHRKLVHYKGKMSDFVKKHPEAKHYFKLSTTDLKFVFPNPGRLEGVKTSTQKFLEMDGVDFRYPGSDVNTIDGACVKMSLSSRVAITGANGAGKTTLVRMMVGDSQPSNLGQCRFWIHHNLRVAYVSQHAFFHVEQHLDEAPAKYIQWRFKDSYDREKIESEGYRISPEEQKRIDDFQLEGIWSRRVRAGVLEYEVKKRNVREKDNKYYSKGELLSMGFEKLLRQTDEKIAAKEAGLDLRPTTITEIQKHLDDFGLEQEFGTYGKVRGLSGGQKVKLVLAAAMWNCPHLLSEFLRFASCARYEQILPVFALHSRISCSTPLPSPKSDVSSFSS